MSDKRSIALLCSLILNGLFICYYHQEPLLNSKLLNMFQNSFQRMPRPSFTSDISSCTGEKLTSKSVGKEHFGCHLNKLMHWVRSLSAAETRVYSQQGEDGITQAIFSKIGHGNKSYVEFGVEDGTQCNSRILREHHGWKGIMFDGGHHNPNIGLFKESIWFENVIEIFAKYSIPNIFDLLSIDTDMSDFWLINTILENGYKPRVIITELNRNFDAFSSTTVQLQAAKSHLKWDGTRYFGASLLAMAKLMHSYGYQLIYVDKNAINAFFVDKNELNRTDIALAAWVAMVSKDSLISKPLHRPATTNFSFVHVCLEEPCINSSYW